MSFLGSSLMLVLFSADHSRFPPLGSGFFIFVVKPMENLGFCLPDGGPFWGPFWGPSGGAFWGPFGVHFGGHFGTILGVILSLFWNTLIMR